MPLAVRSFVVSPFAENTYVVSSGGEAAVIDPGTATPAERLAVEAYIEEAGLRVRHLLLTHAHLDHVFGAAHFADRYGDTAEHGGWRLHPSDEPLLANVVRQGQVYGVQVDEPPAPAAPLVPGETLGLGDATFEIRHVPGHSPGSVAFYAPADGLVIAGDALFAGSIGRTDLWQGDTDTLLASIRDQLLTLPDETTVYSGHGPTTTIGAERRSNPFLQGV